MPALNSYAFETLVALAKASREAFIDAKIRPEADVEAFAQVSVDDALASDAAAPEKLARLTDAYLTALYSYKGEPFNGAFRRAKEALGRSDMVDIGIIFAALGTAPNPKSGFQFNEKSYLA